MEPMKFPRTGIGLNLVPQDHGISFNIPPPLLELQKGEVLIDSMDAVENAKSTDGSGNEQGELMITNLRLIWVSRSNRHENISVGYNSIAGVNICNRTSLLFHAVKANSNNIQVLQVFTKSEEESCFEFISTNPCFDNNYPRLFATVQTVFRPYDTSKLREHGNAKQKKPSEDRSSSPSPSQGSSPALTGAANPPSLISMEQRQRMEANRMIALAKKYEREARLLRRTSPPPQQKCVPETKRKSSSNNNGNSNSKNTAFATCSQTTPPRKAPPPASSNLPQVQSSAESIRSQPGATNLPDSFRKGVGGGFALRACSTASSTERTGSGKAASSADGEEHSPSQPPPRSCRRVDFEPATLATTTNPTLPPGNGMPAQAAAVLACGGRDLQAAAPPPPAVHRQDPVLRAHPSPTALVGPPGGGPPVAARLPARALAFGGGGGGLWVAVDLELCSPDHFLLNARWHKPKATAPAGRGPRVPFSTGRWLNDWQSRAERPPPDDDPGAGAQVWDRDWSSDPEAHQRNGIFPGPLEYVMEALESTGVLRRAERVGVGERTSLALPLQDYNTVIGLLRRAPLSMRLQGAEVRSVPGSTRSALCNRLAVGGMVGASPGGWVPLRVCHLADTEVAERMLKLPEKLQRCLLPFQVDGVRYALRRGGRCLLADEMGIGKTIQAIAVAACYREAWPLLVVCPASMRLPWAEELERWLPCLSPRDIHLVFGRKDDVPVEDSPVSVTVVSYTMLARLKGSLGQRPWGVVIVDESHNMRTTKSPHEPEETRISVEVVKAAKYAILLSGTPSLTRPFDIYNQADCLWPGLLGPSKYQFADQYCMIKHRASHNTVFKDYSKGKYLQELNVLLSETIMLRRLKQDVLAQLPPKRRQVIRLHLDPADRRSATERAATHVHPALTRRRQRGAAARPPPPPPAGTDSSAAPPDAQAAPSSEPAPAGERSNETSATGGVSLPDGTAEEQQSGSTVRNNCVPGGMTVAEGVPGGVTESDRAQAVAACEWCGETRGGGGCMCDDAAAAEDEVEGERIAEGERIEEEERRQTEMVDDDQGVGTGRGVRKLTYHEIGIAKLRGIKDWLSDHPCLAEPTLATSMDPDSPQNGAPPPITRPSGSTNFVPRMIIFAHHHEVLDDIQAFVHEKKVGSVRIDGQTQAEDRSLAVRNFRLDPQVRVAIVGVTAGGVGLDFSAAQTVVFAELPRAAADLMQAEDRAHRRGQKNAVNIYFFCAKDTDDEVQWQKLSRSLERITTVTNGPLDAVPEFHVDVVDDRTRGGASSRCSVPGTTLPESETGAEVQRTKGQLERTEVGGADCETSCATSNIVRPEVDAPGGSLADSTGQNCCPLQEEGEGEVPGAVGRQGLEGEASDAVSIPPRSLMFEISRHTGRMHVFATLPEDPLEPTAVGANVRLEDLEALRDGGGAGSDDPGSVPSLLARSQEHRAAALLFADEWAKLRPVEMRRLQGLGRPLRLPLSAELATVATLAGPGGVMPGGSKRRITPREEAGAPLPEGASWRNVAWRHPRFGTVRRAPQAFSAAGEPLCRMCQLACRGERAKAPSCFLDLFCSSACHGNFLSRTSSRFNRERLFELERGRCVQCKLDTHALVELIRVLPVPQRRAHILATAPAFANHPTLLQRLVECPCEGNAWHADHIVAVYEGGGECEMENLRTLCVVCHSTVTAAQAQRRAAIKRNFMEALDRVRVEAGGKPQQPKKRPRNKKHSQHPTAPLSNDQTALHNMPPPPTSNITPPTTAPSSSSIADRAAAAELGDRHQRESQEDPRSGTQQVEDLIAFKVAGSAYSSQRREPVADAEGWISARRGREEDGPNQGERLRDGGGEQRRTRGKEHCNDDNGGNGNVTVFEEEGEGDEEKGDGDDDDDDDLLGVVIAGSAYRCR